MRAHGSPRRYVGGRTFEPANFSLSGLLTCAHANRDVYIRCILLRLMPSFAGLCTELSSHRFSASVCWASNTALQVRGSKTKGVRVHCHPHIAAIQKAQTLLDHIPVIQEVQGSTLAPLSVVLTIWACSLTHVPTMELKQARSLAATKTGRSQKKGWLAHPFGGHP